MWVSQHGLLNATRNIYHLTRIGGHEGAGYVVALGSDVKDLNIGDAVGIQVRQ